MALHHLEPTVEKFRWGLFDAGAAPVLTVQSGDGVLIGSVSGSPSVMPGAETGSRSTRGCGASMPG